MSKRNKKTRWQKLQNWTKGRNYDPKRPWGKRVGKMNFREVLVYFMLPAITLVGLFYAIILMSSLGIKGIVLFIFFIIVFLAVLYFLFS